MSQDFFSLVRNLADVPVLRIQTALRDETKERGHIRAHKRPEELGVPTPVEKPVSTPLFHIARFNLTKLIAHHLFGATGKVAEVCYRN